MLTLKQKNTLLRLLKAVEVSGNREQVKRTEEELSALEREVEALPTQDETPGKEGPAQPAGKKKKKSDPAPT